MHTEHHDPSHAIKVGLLAVIAMMSWPVWGEIVAGFHQFTWTVAASGLVPLTLTMLVVAVAVDGPARFGGGVRRLEHTLHVDNLLHHGHTHRHA